MTKQQRNIAKTALLAFCLACEEPMEEMEVNHIPQDLSVSGKMHEQAAQYQAARYTGPEFKLAI